MAYNNQKGPQHTGDIQYEGDPNETQIDFDDDFVALKTNGQQRFIVSGSAITSSVNFVPSGDETLDLGSADLNWRNIYAQEFFGDLEGAIRFDAQNDEGDTITKGQVVYINGVVGQTPTVALAACDVPSKMPAFGLAAETAADGASIQIITMGSINSLNLTSLYDKTFAEGDVVYVETGSNGTSGSLTNVVPTGSANLLQNMGKIIRDGGGSDGQIKVGGAGRRNATPNLDKGYLFIGNDSDQSVADNTIFVSSSANKVGINNTDPDHTLTITGDVSASAAISASSFHGDGSGLTGLPSAAITTYNSSSNNRIITSVDSTTVQGESNLTFDGTELIVSGVLTVDGGAGVGSRVYFNVPEESNAFRVRKSGGNNVIRFDNDSDRLFFNSDTRVGSDTIAPDHALSVTGDISASVNISASAFYGDGSNLDGISAGPITNYNSAGATRIITSVDASTVQGESNLTFDGSVLSVTGDVSAQRITSSVGIHVTGANPSIAIGDRAGGGPQEGMLAIRPSDTNNKTLALMQGTDASGGRIALGVSGSGAITVGGAHFGGLINVTGSGTETLISAKSDLHGSLLEVKGSGAVGILNLDPKTALDVHHNPTTLANDTGGGEVVKFGAGTTIQGKTYYLHSNGNWDEVDISVPASGGLGMLATALGTSPSVDGMLIRGFFDYNTQLVGGFTTGATVYLSGSGQLTTIRPSGSGQSVRVVGTCTTTGNVIYFNPSPDYLVVV